MIPSTGTLVLLNRSTARRASISDRSCGVETITAPAGRERWISDSCTSPVPGGRSTSSSSQSPQSASISLASAPVAIGPRQASAWPGETSWPERQESNAVRLDRDQLFVLGRRLLVGAEQRRLRRAIDVGVDQPDLLAHPRQRDGEVGRDRRLADAALAAADRDQRPRGLRGGHRDPRLAHAGDRQRRCAQLVLERIARPSRTGRWRRR